MKTFKVLELDNKFDLQIETIENSENKVTIEMSNYDNESVQIDKELAKKMIEMLSKEFNL